MKIKTRHWFMATQVFYFTTVVGWNIFVATIVWFTIVNLYCKFAEL